MALLLSLLFVACDHGFADPGRELADAVPADSALHRVEIHRPGALGRLDTAITDASGAPVGVACATCHSPGVSTPIAEGEGPPERFHGAVKLQHGSLVCESCHDADRTLLHLADGATLEFGDTMTLCSQCHGTQRRSYDHGAHGGMSGYYDLRQGPRLRNNCVDCHAPHGPKYPNFLPVFPPRDRFFGENP